MRIAVMVVWLSVAAASQVAAQDRGATVAGTLSAATVDSTTAFSFSGSGGYQMSPTIAFEIEATAVPRAKLPVDASAPTTLASGAVSSANELRAIYPGLGLTPADGREVIFTTNIRVHLRAPARRIAPFVMAGGGVANLRRAFDVTLPVFHVPPGVTSPIEPITQRVTTSSADLALTIGGGVDLGLAAHLAISVDLRYFRLFSDRDLNLGRFGAGVRYRF